MEKRDFTMVNPVVFEKGYLKKLKEKSDNDPKYEPPAPHDMYEFTGSMENPDGALRAEGLLFACEAVALAHNPTDAFLYGSTQDPNYEFGKQGYMGCVSSAGFGGEYGGDELKGRLGTVSDFVNDYLLTSQYNPVCAFLQIPGNGFGTVYRYYGNSWERDPSPQRSPLRPSVADLASLAICASSVSAPDEALDHLALSLAVEMTGIAYEFDPSKPEGGMNPRYSGAIIYGVQRSGPLLTEPVVAVPLHDTRSGHEGATWKEEGSDFARFLRAGMSAIEDPTGTVLSRVKKMCDATDYVKEGHEDEQTPTYDPGSRPPKFGTAGLSDVSADIARAMGGLTFRTLADPVGTGTEATELTYDHTSDSGTTDTKCETEYDEDGGSTTTCTTTVEPLEPRPITVTSAGGFAYFLVQGYYYVKTRTTTTDKDGHTTYSYTLSSTRLKYCVSVSGKRKMHLSSLMMDKSNKVEMSKFVSFSTPVLLVKFDFTVNEFTYDGHRPESPYAGAFSVVVPVHGTARQSSDDVVLEFDYGSLDVNALYSMAEAQAGEGNDFYTLGGEIVGVELTVTTKTLE